MGSSSRTRNPIINSLYWKRFQESLLKKQFFKYKNGDNWQQRDYCWQTHLPAELVLSVTRACVLVVSSSVITTWLYGDRNRCANANCELSHEAKRWNEVKYQGIRNRRPSNSPGFQARVTLIPVLPHASLANRRISGQVRATVIQCTHS
jgi:hypothetical protein